MTDNSHSWMAGPQPQKPFTPGHYNEHWLSVDEFTIYQAAFLWCEVEPINNFGEHTYCSLPESFRAILAMLIGAANQGQLKAEKELNFEKFATVQSRVSRDSLKAFAEKKERYPAFLFDTVNPPHGTPSAADVGGAAKAASKGGRPEEYNWNMIYAGVVYQAELDGIPSTLDQLSRDMIAFVENGYSRTPSEAILEFRAPSHTTMNDRLRPIYNNLKELGWKSSVGGN